MTRQRVAILFGGQSVEHEISIVSAREVLGAIDRRRYAPLPLYVNREGRWFCGERLDQAMNSDRRDVFTRDNVRRVLEPFLTEVALLPVPGIGGVVPIGGAGKLKQAVRASRAGRTQSEVMPVDVFMPVFHGTFGEDGCMQGLFELAQVAYTGCNTVASAVGMHKHFAKQLIQANGVDCLPGLLVKKRELADFDAVCRRIHEGLSFPCFVKPCNLGSSVGISKQSVVRSDQDLANALVHAFRYDDAAIIEPYVTDMRELQVAIVRGQTLHVSAVEAPLVKGINTAASKYGTDMLSSGSKGAATVGLENADREIDPQELPPGVLGQVTAAARQIYNILDCAGVVRVDFFFDRQRSRLFFNEINTLPGSMSSFLFHGLNPCLLFTEVVNIVIESALELHAARDNLKRTHAF